MGVAAATIVVAVLSIVMAGITIEIQNWRHKRRTEKRYREYKNSRRNHDQRD